MMTKKTMPIEVEESKQLIDEEEGEQVQVQELLIRFSKWLKQWTWSWNRIHRTKIPNSCREHPRSPLSLHHLQNQNDP